MEQEVLGSSPSVGSRESLSEKVYIRRRFERVGGFFIGAWPVLRLAPTQAATGVVGWKLPAGIGNPSAFW